MKKEFVGSSKITRNYQITIPKRIREKMKLKQGDILAFYMENGKIVIRRE